MLSACDNTHHQPEQPQSKVNQADNALLAQAKYIDNNQSTTALDDTGANRLLEYQGLLEYQQDTIPTTHLTYSNEQLLVQNDYEHLNGQDRQEVIKHFADASPMLANAHLISGLGATLIGDYQGVFPCEDCESIKVTLNLYADGSALKTSIHHFKNHTPPPSILAGRYTQNHDVISLVFNNTTLNTLDGDVSHFGELATNDPNRVITERYLIDDNQLILLNDGQTNFESSNEHFNENIDPAYTSNYILSRY